MESKSQVWSVGTSLGLFSNFSGLIGSVWFYPGSMKTLNFKKDHFNQYDTFYKFIKTKSKFLVQF